MTKTTEEMIAVMQAYVDGKPIEAKSEIATTWHLSSEPSWNWGRCDYRIAVTKPSIDWSHVAKNLRFLFTQENGRSIFCENKPNNCGTYWIQSGVSVSANHFASFRPGTCDWSESLVERPEGI